MDIIKLLDLLLNDMQLAGISVTQLTLESHSYRALERALDLSYTTGIIHNAPHGRVIIKPAV